MPSRLRAKELLRPPSWWQSLCWYVAGPVWADMFLITFWLVLPITVIAIPVAPVFVVLNAFGFPRGLVFLCPYVALCALWALSSFLYRGRTRDKLTKNEKGAQNDGPGKMGQCSTDTNEPRQVPVFSTDFLRDLRRSISTSRGAISFLTVFVPWFLISLLMLLFTATAFVTPFVIAFRYFSLLPALVCLLPCEALVVVIFGLIVLTRDKMRPGYLGSGTRPAVNSVKSHCSGSPVQHPKIHNILESKDISRPKPALPAKPRLKPLEEPDEIPTAALKKSSICRYKKPSGDEVAHDVIWAAKSPLFKTMRVSAEPKNNLHCTLRISFVFLDTLLEEIVLDDIHNALYDMTIARAAPLTIGYRGEVYLLQDNTLLKQKGESYSLKPGEGYEMDLVFEFTANEPSRFVFGLLVDYYSISGNSITRSAMPSDCIYMLKHDSKHSFGSNTKFELTAIDFAFVDDLRKRYMNDPDLLEYVAQIETVLIRHTQFHATPLP